MTPKKDPALLGKLVDELETKRRARMAIEKSLESARADEDEMKQRVLDALAAAKLDGARGTLAQVTRKLTPIPIVTDWAKFYRYITKHNAFDLLHRRVTNTAIAERWEAGEVVSGVARENRLTLHVSSLKVEA